MRGVTGRSAAVARLLWEQNVAGSIPAVPIALRGITTALRYLGEYLLDCIRLSPSLLGRGDGLPRQVPLG